MSEHELNRLLGAFAADTLTSEEKQHLYTAALQDQQLFNALADEQALKDLLADPEVRRRLLEALRRPPAGEQTSLSWLHWFIRPQALTWAGGLTVAVLATVLGTKVYQDSLREPWPQPAFLATGIVTAQMCALVGAETGFGAASTRRAIKAR